MRPASSYRAVCARWRRQRHQAFPQFTAAARGGRTPGRAQTARSCRYTGKRDVHLRRRPASAGREAGHYLPIIMIRTDFAARIEQDSAGVITEWNAGAQGLFGWTRAEAIGQPSNMLIPARNRERHDQSLRTFLAARHGTSHSQRVTAIHRDGHELLVEFTLSAQTIGGVRRI